MLQVIRVAATFLLLMGLALRDASAQHNLRTHPTTPTAGQSFQVQFEDNQCLTFLTESPGAPPTVQLIGSTLRVAVDIVQYSDCMQNPGPFTTFAVAAPGLPAGDYQLELIGRAFQAPNNFGTLQTVPITIAAPLAAATIPATDAFALLILAISIGIAGTAVGKALRD
jgi:hypothetical protein